MSPDGSREQPQDECQSTSKPFPDNTVEEQNETEKLRKLFDRDFNMFLLNNILMSVQFFENYDRDIEKIRDRCLEETSLSADQFACLEADSLHELVAEKVIFQNKSGPRRNEMIHPLRTYVTYKNVELANDSSSLSKHEHKTPYYKLVVQKCEDDTKEESGYVNLIDSASTVAQPYNAWVGTRIHHPDAFQEQKSPTQSGVPVSKNDNYYLEPSRRSKPYHINAYRTGERISSPASLPGSCFKEFEKQAASNRRRRMGISLKQQVIQKMLISAAFKRHFAEVFMECLWKQMKFDKTKCGAATFHHDHITVNETHKTRQIIPVLEMKPYAVDFPDYKPTKTKWMEWPTYDMTETIKKSGCSLLPMGYYEASDEKNDYTLEWKIIFPKAEKYLMMHMMHAQVRCYLFALILYKSFIETESSYVHFGPAHIANLLFLMVRNDFAGWPEYNQGNTLVRFLTVLCNTVRGKSLGYFFLRKRNLYANSPLRVMHRVQTLLTRIIENPIPHILKGLTNLKCSEDFHPQLDYLKLYNILTVKDLEEYLYPKEVKGRKKNKPPTYVREVINEKELLQVNRTPLLEVEILRIFTNHFVEVANQSRRYEAYDYGMLYLTHAKRLLAILSEKSVTKGEIYHLTKRIKNVTALCKTHM